jgi:hypothetical protein
MISVPIALGELIDKITILEIKEERIADETKRRNISNELKLLRDVRDGAVAQDEVMRQLTDRLKKVNEQIWDLEDTIRNCERTDDFGQLFLTTARQIYRTNDQRAALKRDINLNFGSSIIEEKSYSQY